jgi:nucleoside phosphorylase
MTAQQNGALVCFAVKTEARPFKPKRGTRVIVTGMGARNAVNSLEAAIQRQRPSIVWSCGFAGGLNPRLHPGTVVFSTPDDLIAERLRDAGAVRGMFELSGRVAITAREKKQLWEETGSDAVEMESLAMAPVCARENIPFVIVRVISDGQTDNLPLDFNLLMTPEMKLSAWKLACAIAKAPRQLPALIKLGETSKAAALYLTEVLNQVVEPG